MICKNLSFKNGHLFFADYDTAELAKDYKTPLMLFDEIRFKENINTYKKALKESFDSESMPVYASKALCFSQIYNILNEEEIGADVVSSGELYTAIQSGFPAERIFFHGNNKTDEDILFGISSKVGYFVCDNREELLKIEETAASQGIVQKVIIRLTPNVDAHTLEAINTGKLDSKFGVAIENGKAEKLIKIALGLKFVKLCGFHCHIGSQIFDAKPFVTAAETVADFCLYLKDAVNFETQILNLGGGIATRYSESDPYVDIAHIISVIGKTLHEKFDGKIKFPKIIMEPGRSMVADCGMTLYTVGAIKEIPNVKNYVSVDGGMADNPRFALYGAPYTVVLANRTDDKCDYKCTVAGRCCESGDILQENVMLPKPQRGDLLAVLTTGAYNYSMSSNYNRLTKPPIIALSKEGARIVVRRETFSDLISCDVVLNSKDK